MNIRVYQGDKDLKNMSKAASLILCASFMMSICSCEAMQRQPKETEDLTKPVVDLADDLGRYIVNLDYGSIRNMSTILLSGLVKGSRTG